MKEQKMIAKDINYYKVKLSRDVIDCSKDNMLKTAQTIEVEV